MIKRAWLWIGLFYVLTSCAPKAPEELERLTKTDPAFAQMILTRDQVKTQVRAIKGELLQRKRILDAQTAKSRREYDAHAKAQNLIIEKYLSTVEADRNLLKREMDTSSAQLEAKLTELGGYQKTLSDVKKVLTDTKGLELSQEEKQKWEERALLLSERIRPMEEEIQEIRLKIRLAKRKIRYL